MKEDYDISYKADGVRFNWNVFPSTRLEAAQLLTPIGCLYTPFHQRESWLKPVPVINQYPVSCNACQNYISPYIQIDRANRMWHCPYCQEKNFFEEGFKLPDPQSSLEEWPVELRPSSSTVEYTLPNSVGDVSGNFGMNYVFVVDTYQHIDEVKSNTSSFQALKAQMCKTIESLPDGARIGLVTFDEYVTFHELKNLSSIVITNHDIFPTDKETNTISQPQKTSLFGAKVPEGVLSKLGLRPHVAGDMEDSSLNKFLVEVNGETRPSLINYIRELKPKLSNSYKPSRSTGLASYLVSLVLNKASYKGFMGKILLFLGGPCTNYPGNIIDLAHETHLRTHKDIASFQSTQFLPSLKFYKTLALMACGLTPETANTIVSSTSKKEADFPVDSNLPRWSFDLFTGSLDQVGIYEMKSLALKTMGNIFLYDSFISPQFEQQLETIFKVKGVKYNTNLIVKTSQQLKISRMIGHGHSLPSSYQAEKYHDLHHEKISDHLSQYDSSSKKKNFTNSWGFNLIDPKDTISIFFEPELANTSGSLDGDGAKEMYIQFQLKYWDRDLQSWKLRITNLCKKTTLSYLVANKVKMSDGSYKLINSKSSIIKQKELFSSFDQYAFISLITRLLLDKIDTTLGFEQFDNIIKDFDKCLVKLLHNFGGLSLKSMTNQNPYYTSLMDQLAESYQINENFKHLPTLGYHLRKNPQLIKIFNSLPDETAFYHHWFMRMNCEDSVKVIQPELVELNESSEPVPLALDTEVVLKISPQSFVIMDSIFNTVIYTNSEHLQLHHSNNKHLITDKALETPMKFVKDRKLVSNIVITKKDHSQARYLFARLDSKDELEEFGSLNLQPKGFFGFLKKKSVLADDTTLEKYYGGLVESIKAYRAMDE